MRSDVPIGANTIWGIGLFCHCITDAETVIRGSKTYVISAVFEHDNDESQFIDVMSEYLNQPVEKVKITEAKSNAEFAGRSYVVQRRTHSSFSNVALYLLMKKANELGITVILSGQGADELLCGYKKYLVFYFQYLARTAFFQQFDC